MTVIYENLWVVIVRRGDGGAPFEVGPREKPAADALADRLRKEHPGWVVSVKPAGSP